MIISNAQIIKTYQAEVVFDQETIFLPDSKANDEFKKTFASSLLEAKSHEGHWQTTRAHMKTFAESELCQSLPDIGFWKKDFKQAFKDVLEAVNAKATK